jgi:hypothetical protein
MLSKQKWGVLACILSVAATTCSVGCNRSPSLKERIKATASRLKSPDTFPASYEQEIIHLAKEPTDALRKAFRTLDAERYPGRGSQPPNDPVWLTGTLITILAFDCPPIANRDWPIFYKLKPMIVPPFDLKDKLRSLKHDAATNKMLAEWPWSDRGGSWHLLSIRAYRWGSSSGAITPTFEYYERNFKRRRMP